MWQPGRTLAQIEKEVIEAALRFYQGNKTQAANSLGIAVRTIYNKLGEIEPKAPQKSKGELK